MPRTVSFPGGRKVTFRRTARKPGKRKLSAWNKIVKKSLPGLVKKGMSPTAAMKKIARDRKKK